MKWTTLVTWVDSETGEILQERKALQHYYIHQKIKKTTFNEQNTEAVVRVTNLCRPKPTIQQRFKF